jgi:esterase FrsA
MAAISKRVLTSVCAGMGLTERAANRLGAGYFVPELFVARYTHMGQLDCEVFAEQLAAVRSFTDEGWCGPWGIIAADREARALQELEGPARCALLREAITYYAVSAFPGGSAARMRAYWKSRECFDLLLGELDETWEKLRMDVEGEHFDAYLRLPEGSGGPYPVVVLSNGLEGTIQELVLPLVGHYRERDVAVLVMEMPGTYAYRQPMSDVSQRIYDTVIDQVIARTEIDATRVGFMGVSFGGYWAARIAATNPLIKCAIACGPPTHHTFKRAEALGIPEVMIGALKEVSGAKHLLTLNTHLQKLSLQKRGLYERIQIPLLVINGAQDSLVSVKDSIDLATKAPNAMLKLYDGDDHCAMGHYRDWLDLSFAWCDDQLHSTTFAAYG